MKTVFVTIFFAALSVVALAGQPDAKGERMARVQKELATQEKILATYAKVIEYCEKQGMRGPAETAKRALADAPAKIAALKLELSWLKGEITLASAEKKFADAQAAVDKLTKDDKPCAEEQKALDAAKAELEQVKKWEADAAKDF